MVEDDGSIDDGRLRLSQGFGGPTTREPHDLRRHGFAILLLLGGAGQHRCRLFETDVVDAGDEVDHVTAGAATKAEVALILWIDHKARAPVAVERALPHKALPGGPQLHAGTDHNLLDRVRPAN